MSRANNVDTIREPSRDPDLVAVLETVIRNVMLTLHVSAPGKVELFDPSKQRATITTEILAVYNTAQGIEEPQGPFKIDNVPVYFPRSGTSHDTMPIVPGTTGMLLFSDRSLAKWLSQGIPAPPGQDHAHREEDAVFFAGFSHGLNAIQNFDMTARVIEATQIKIGANATEEITKATSLLAALDAAFAAASSAAGGVNPPNGDGGSAAFTALISTWNAQKTAAKAIKGKVE